MADWSHLQDEIDPNPPASGADIAAAQERCGGRLPADYLDFLAHHDGGESVSHFDRASEIGPADALVPDSPHFEGLILFGGDGGGTAFCFDAAGDVVVQEFIGDGEDARNVGDFTRFTHRLAAGEVS